MHFSPGFYGFMSGAYCVSFIALFIFVQMFQQDSDVFSLVFCALESIHVSLAVMAHNDMPKQLYHEEVCASFE